MFKRGLLVFLLLCSASWAHAGDAVIRVSYDAPMETIYPKLYAALEAERLFVVFEPDIGANLKRMAPRWGEDYNRSGLSGIRSMVFCNAWYANQVSNLAPEYLALCPMHLTLMEKDGQTTALFVRPSVIAQGSAVALLMQELEASVEQAMRSAGD